jgi:hypothetical protein
VPDIFDEVNEDLRAERARQLASKYGVLVAAALVLTLIATGAYVWRQQQQSQQADIAAAKFIAAQKAADVHLPAKPSPATLTEFASLADTGPEGYRVLARLQLAALEWNQGKTAPAVADWAAVSNDAGAPQVLRDLATLSSVQHQIDTGDAQALKTQLQPILSGASAWKALAEQALAMLEIRLGHVDAARSIIKSLVADPAVTEGVRQMAADLLLTLGDAPSKAATKG